MEAATVTHKSLENIATQNREILRAAGAFTLNIMGNPGWGKTSLIAKTMARLIPCLHVGVIYSTPEMARDGHHLAALGDQTVQIDPGHDHLISAQLIHQALLQLDLDELDVLLIENISSLAGPIDQDLGENSKVVIFSAAAGDDKAKKYSHVVSGAAVVILNKIDLLPSLGFNLDSFRADTHRLNPSARTFEISTADGSGLDEWVEWLKQQVETSRRAEIVRGQS